MTVTRKKKLLLCDDEEDILDICESILQPDYEVYVVERFTEIVNTIHTVKPDLVLMDLWLWGNRGEDVIREMQNDKLVSHIPVIIFSAKDDLERIAAEMNVCGFLRKPFSMKELREKIAASLRESHESMQG